MKITNRAPNPNFEVSAAGVNFSACAGGLTSYEPMIATGSKALSVTASASPTTVTYVLETAPASPGEWVGFGINARYSSKSRYIKMRLLFRNDANADVAGGSSYSPVFMLQGSAGGGGRFVHSALAPEGTTKVLCFIYLFEGSAGTAAPLAGSVYSTDAWSIVGAPTQAEAVAAATTYFDGDSVSGGGLSYGWDGTPGLSSSYRVDSLDLVHPWSRAWWETLPHAYRDADAVQNPGVGYFPLMRWMNGIGALAGQMRDLSDSLWAGDLTDVERAPDEAVRWLAQMLGVDETQRARTTASLRGYLADLTLTGRPAVGTRASISEVARRYLTGDKQVGVMPSATTPFTIVLLVRATEVPNGGDLAAFATTIKAAGVVPAGHNLIVVNAVPTWDQWQAAAGASWDELEAKAKTWNDADALGVTIS